MSNLNGNGTAQNGSAPHFTLTPPNFDAGAVAAFWQSSAARLLRSSEVFMRGMAEVARLEAELGQQLLQRGMAGLKIPPQGEALEERARAQLGHASHEFESLIASLRKIGDESRSAYRDATLALFDTGSPAGPKNSSAGRHIDDPVIKPKPAPHAASPARANAAE